MAEDAPIGLKPSVRAFFAWATVSECVTVGFVASYEAIWWPLFNVIPEGNVGNYIARSLAICTAFFFTVLILLILPMAIAFALQRAYWEAWPGGVAYYRGGELRGSSTWEGIERVVVRPLGIRLRLRGSFRSERLIGVWWSDSRTFAQYCRQRMASPAIVEDPASLDS